MSGNQFRLWGRQLLEQIAAANEAIDVRGIVVELDRETDELERISALVTVVGSG
jgi:hypothetical protein